MFEQIRLRFGVGSVIVSSLIGHSLDALATGLPTELVCHDYFPLWPVLHADFDAVDGSAASLAQALVQARVAEFPRRARAGILAGVAGRLFLRGCPVNSWS
ncbi:MAG: hypothetical protein IPP28_07255 [Xanthomonadales bacterium]|nr:hypothetical protein [Xanthomonadales bacterium]